MSDSLGESLLRNLIHLDLDDAPSPHFSRRIRSERLAADLALWSPVKPDRSLSLTDAPHKPHEVPPPPGFPPLPSNRYKTELCRGFQEHGLCKYGGKCQFAHGPSELRGLHRHPKYKTQACRTFYQFGYCPYGGRCHFIHQDQPDPRLLRHSLSFAGFARAPSPDALSPVFSDSFSFAGEGLAPFLSRDRAGLQRFPSEDSLSDRESYSSGGSDSPTFDASGGKRLSVFARMSLSD